MSPDVSDFLSKIIWASPSESKVPFTFATGWEGIEAWSAVTEVRIKVRILDSIAPYRSFVGAGM